uniref:SNF related kinase a n=1 Tax=Kryptolebias marmoratus TaxID=37003 RepID=A0A3Q3FLH6_KRYMA
SPEVKRSLFKLRLLSKRRASLEEIESHTWLQGVDPSPATKYSTPLISHKHLSEEEHNSIIQRMVLGDIADREAIVEALETNKYNHITATYYLLAERILREKQEKEVQTRSSSPSNIKAHFRQSWPTRMDMHQDIEDTLASSSISHCGGPQSPARSAENLLNGHRSKGMMELGRREESSAMDSVGPSAQVFISFKSAYSEEDEEEEEEQDLSPLPTQVILRRKAPSITNRLTSRKSAPVLNQIFEEEGESDDDFDMDEGLPPKLSSLSSGAASPGPSHKRYHRRKSQGRGSSCSSSETSDDDSESHRRRLDKDSGFSYSWNRRDSSEGPPGSEGGNGGGSSSGPPGAGGGQDSPSSCCNNSSTTKPSLGSVSQPSRTASRSSELVKGLKLMSLCLSSQLQQHRSGRGGRGGKFIIDPRSVKIQEKSSWRMCISSSGTVPRVPPGLKAGSPSRHVHSNLSALKNGVLQLPLCEKSISVNIQGRSRDGLLCTSAPASCCQVI